MEEVLRQLGQRVRSVRTGAGLTQEDLAERTGLHRTYIGDIERGERNVSTVNLYKLSRALGMALSELLEGVDGGE
jgi:transcriptional regulator with XRE-family HTH domain